MRIAIMQPYFIPYAGYFRLFYAADLFVIYDCVQFIRRGWIHRNRLTNANGELQWLTLPLKKAPQDIIIKNLDFSDKSQDLWQERLRCFPQLLTVSAQETRLLKHIFQLNLSPLEYIISTLNEICRMLNLPFNVVRSSSLNLPASLKGEEKIIEIARYYQAKKYINLAGGRALYNLNTFKQHNIELQFLSDYQGSYDSMLQRTLKENSVNLRNEIIKQSNMENL